MFIEKENYFYIEEFEKMKKNVNIQIAQTTGAKKKKNLKKLFF